MATEMDKYDPDLLKRVADALVKAESEFVGQYGLAGRSVSMGNYKYARAAIDAVMAYEDDLKLLYLRRKNESN